MGEGVWVNSSSSNAGSGPGRSSTLTSSSTTRTSSEDDEAIIADVLFRVAMDLVSQQVYGDAERHFESLGSASKWREAEVRGASTTREETWITVEILAHSVRWSEMCDRWLSYTRDRERFAPDMTPSVRLGATLDRSGSPGGSGRRQKELQGDGGGSTSSSSSITFSGANGATYNGVTYGN
ncbi:unnamed protein product, partial [Ascophyllum nodosum]